MRKQAPLHSTKQTKSQKQTNHEGSAGFCCDENSLSRKISKEGASLHSTTFASKAAGCAVTACIPHRSTAPAQSAVPVPLKNHLAQQLAPTVPDCQLRTSALTSIKPNGKSVWWISGHLPLPAAPHDQQFSAPLAVRGKHQGAQALWDTSSTSRGVTTSSACCSQHLL